MRKALMGLILAATAMTPVAAWAQDDGNRGDEYREHSDQRQARSERQAERSEARQQRSEARADRQQARQQQQVQQPVQVQDQQIRAFNRRGERNLERARQNQGSWQGNPAVQQRDADDGQRRGRRDDDGRRNRTSQPSIYPEAWQGDPNDPRLRHYQRLEQRNAERGTDRNRRDWQDRGEWRDGRDGRDGRRGDWRDGRRGDWGRNWDRTSWRNDRRYDWQSWRYRNRSLFRSPYYSPFRNHRYSRFSIGLFLEPLFYNQRYWLNDPWQYRLPYAPPGTQWVRYYNDVLLVDVYSGEVVDVIYDFFW